MTNEQGAKSLITSNPEILGGRPVVKGTRLSVAFIHGLLAAGWSEEQILENYPQLSQQALQEIQTSSGQSQETAMLSEAALAEDWDRPEEDEAWKHLQQVKQKGSALKD